VQRVLFVSKPIAPPFHDGTKCLVRDIALHVRTVEPIVMSLRGTPPLGARVHMAAVYSSAGHFTPGLSDNARAAFYLLRARANLWHFVFAPNPRTSLLGRVLRTVRRIPVVQTVASPPRRFSPIERLLFGDIVVAQSRWTQQRIIEAWQTEAVPVARRPRLEVIWPSVPELVPRSTEVISATRRALGIPSDAPLFVYPGDLETGGGAERVARLVEPLSRELPGAVVVFAYRAKTPHAAVIARKLEARLEPRAARFTSSLPDVLALIAGATAVLFPVDDLWGKVDLPIVLLESMQLGVPVVALDEGPLADLEGVVKVKTSDTGRWLGASTELAKNDQHRARVIEAQRACITRRHRAEAVARAYEALYGELLG
jgi:glycosyltransferase involved in cell wall biosynthesis